MEPQFVMSFVVALPRPLPLVAEATVDDDGSLSLPRKVKGLVLPIGAAATFYGIPAADLRRDWVRAALLDPLLGARDVHRWGVAYAEWLAVLKDSPDVKAVRMKHVVPDGVAGPLNDPVIQAAAANDCRWRPQDA